MSAIGALTDLLRHHRGPFGAFVKIKRGLIAAKKEGCIPPVLAPIWLAALPGAGARFQSRLTLKQLAKVWNRLDNSLEEFANNLEPASSRPAIPSLFRAMV